jgi:hypothetical protein
MSDAIPAQPVRDLLTQIAARLGRIESDITELKTDSKEMRRDITGLRESVATISGRLTGMPTTLQAVGIAWSILVGLPTVAALAVFILKTTGSLP